MEQLGAIIIEGHIQGLSNTRSLGEVGIPIYVIDKNNCLARYSKYCNKFFRCPEYNTDEFITFLISLAETENIRNWVLIPSNDHALYSISKNKTILESYYKIIVDNFDVIEKIYDKSKLLSFAKECNLPVPETISIRNIDEAISKQLSFPLLIKGRNGLTFYKAIGKKALVAHNKSQLFTHLYSIKGKIEIENTFIQELIPNDGTNKTISFTAFCEKGQIKTFWVGAKLREHPIRFGTATFAKSIYNEECHKQSVKLLKALNYSGVCEIEYLKDPRDGYFKLIEINPRTWLWVGLAKACGIDYAKILYSYAMNNKYYYISNYKEGIKWINRYVDFPFSLLEIITMKLRISDYFKSSKGEKVDALWCNKDKKPFFKYLLFLPLFRLTR